MPIFRQFSLRILLALTTLCYCLASDAAVTKQEYFSYVIVCGDASPKLLDFVEASLLREQNIPNNIFQSQNEEEILAHIENSLKVHAPRLTKTLISNYKELKKIANLSSGIKFVIPKDPDNLINLEDCKLKPLATHILTYDDFYDKFTHKILIDQKIWNQLKLSEQVAVILDFAITKENLDANLIASRILTGFLFSNSFEKMSVAEFISFFQTIEFPYFEYKGFNFQFKYTTFENRLPRVANLYKKNSLILNNQNLALEGYILFYPSGNLSYVSLDNCSYRHKIENNSYVDMTGTLNFFDSKTSEISFVENAISPPEGSTFKGHILNIKGRLNLSTANNIEHADVHHAKVKIRDQFYTIGNINDEFSKGSIDFYPDGNITRASGFTKNQIFYRKNMQRYKLANSNYASFDEAGFLTSLYGD